MRYRQSATEGTEGLISIRKIYMTFGPHLKTYWKWFVYAYLGLIGTVLMNLLTPWPLKFIFDYILLDKPIPDTVNQVVNQVLLFGNKIHSYYTSSDSVPVITDQTSFLLTMLCVLIVLFVILEVMFSYVNKYYMAAAGHSITNDVRQRVYDHIQTLPEGWTRSGDIVVRLTSDINSLKKLLIDSIQDLAKYFLTFFSIIFTMLWMDWQLTLVALAIIPPLYFLSFRFSGKVKHIAKKKRSKESAVASIVQETIASVAVVKAFTQERQEKKRLASESDASLRADLKKTKLTGVFRRTVQVIIAIGTATVVWYGAKRVLAGEVTPGDLIVFTAYLKNLYGPIGGFSGLIMEFTTSLVCARRIAEILNTDAVVKDAPDAIDADPFKGEIIYENVTFGYKKGEPVLKDVSFAVKPGQLVALIGSSGTGKSTVVNLLLRFFDPWQGRVLIDRQDIRRFRVESLRRQISVVFQESILFRRSIRDNIAFGKSAKNSEDVSFNEIVEAAKAAKAHEFIMKLPKRYETLLDERGENLSGGQKQRIALARAILRDAPILVLDEPGTGLDAVTEAEIHKTLNHFMQGKTTFMIAHRLSTIKQADLILVIEEGKVIEQGTHIELQKNSSAYRQFYDLQYLDVVDRLRNSGQ